MAEGKLLIFTAPSGSGKTTIVRYLLSKTDNLAFSVSATTRPKRSYEIHGKDYYFLNLEAFQQKVAGNEFLEWEEVYKGAFYGTLRSEVERLWSEGKHVIFDIEVMGAINLKKFYPKQTLAVFIKPPSLPELEKRLRNRKTESEDRLQRRLKRAATELTYADKFDIILENTNLDEAKAKALELTRNFIGYNVRKTE